MNWGELAFTAALALWLLQFLTLVLWRNTSARPLGIGLSLLSAGCGWSLAQGGTISLEWPLLGSAWHLVFHTQAQWLLGFGALAGLGAVIRGTPAPRGRVWKAGVTFSLLGALGVFGLQDAVSFLIAWEVLSLGGALMLLGERLESGNCAQSVLFMLGLLEVGSVALMGAFLWLAAVAGGTGFAGLLQAGHQLAPAARDVVAILFLVGFGAKLGLLPFYEWLPGAYSSGSGASGVLLSGVVLNAAFFGLSRALIDWLPHSLTLSIIVTGVAVLSAIFAILYAFQEDDWRELLSLSSAENAALSVVALGVAILFSSQSQPHLAALAWVVAQIHLAGHSLAKCTLFLAADGIYRSAGDYRIAPRGWMKAGGAALGLGALFATMSLAAMPPQAGFVSEWYLFQSIFHGFELYSIPGRITLALAGAGVALTAAIAFATFIKVLGVGLLGRSHNGERWLDHRGAGLVGIAGLAVLTLGVGMALWIQPLGAAVIRHFPLQAALILSKGPILIPLSAGFAFIGPAKLVVAWTLMAFVPLALIGLAEHRFPVRRAPVWLGGFTGESSRHATTALTFSNALRNFYSFIYRARLDTERELHPEQRYVLRRLTFNYEVAPLFGPALFRPLVRFANWLAWLISHMQSGQMNLYIGFIGLLLVLILIAAFI